MTIKQQRKAICINKTFYISLPPLWVRANNLKKEKILELDIDLDAILIKPQIKKEK
jgi:phosphate uptake regulator